LEFIERQLSSRKLLDLSRSLKKKQVTLSIPKFKITSTLSLKPLLEEMGLTDPFSSRANFSDIDGTQNLQLTDVLQKCFLSVNENGTEAGVATAASIGLKSSLATPPELFTADHPFLFFVADKVTGTFLFLGRVVYPM
jgi:serpin B